MHRPLNLPLIIFCNLFTFWFDSLPKTRELASYVFPLLSPVRQPETCLRWSVEIVENQTVCFGVDDVIVTNTADRPSELHADFDPLNTADWLSLPGGKIHVQLFPSNKIRNNFLKFISSCRVAVKIAKVERWCSMLTSMAQIGHPLEICSSFQMIAPYHLTKSYGELTLTLYSWTNSIRLYLFHDWSDWNTNLFVH